MSPTLAASFFVTLLCGLTLAASISGEPEQADSIRGNANDLSPYMGMAPKAPSNEAYIAWMSYVLRQKQKAAAAAAEAAAAEKRLSDFSMPYMKYRQDKRNGIWVWMPARGYVSVPNQEEKGADALGKPGKIMRYGK